MKQHITMPRPPERGISTILLAGLLIIGFALASFVAIILIDSSKIPTLENDTAWLESYFTKNQSGDLSAKQLDIIHNSAAIVSNVAQDAGVTATLQSVCGNGINTYYKVDVALPNDINAKDGSKLVFDRIELQMNDDKIRLSDEGSNQSVLADFDSTDYQYSFILNTNLKFWKDFDYELDNGIVRTLYLENIRIEGESGQQSKLIEGKWELGIVFKHESKAVELVQDPVIVREFDFWRKSYCEAEITSFELSEFSIHCQYEMLPSSQENIIGLSPVVIMKNGKTVSINSAGGGTRKFTYNLSAPVALDEVAFVKLTDEVVLPINSQKVPTLENDTAWLESYLTKNQTREISQKQKNIIHNSAAIVSNVAHDAGVTVTLQSVCGNGYTTYYKVDVELPEGMNAGEGRFFEHCDLLINDNQFGLSSNGWGSRTLEDENPTDNQYSLLLNTTLNYPQGWDYKFDNGIVRTLHLENIKFNDERDQQSKLIKGKWEFSVLFHDEGKVLELLQQPVAVRGYHYWAKKSYEVEITSFALSEFSAYCKYSPTANSQLKTLNIRPVVIMKDGRTVFMGNYGGGGSGGSFTLRTPISLDEVAFVMLSDEVVLPVQPIRN